MQKEAEGKRAGRKEGGGKEDKLYFGWKVRILEQHSRVMEAHMGLSFSNLLCKIVFISSYFQVLHIWLGVYSPSLTVLGGLLFVYMCMFLYEQQWVFLFCT